MNERVFKWYYTKENDFPNDKETIQFEDNNNILHLGVFYKKDQFDRENVFVSTVGAYFTTDKVPAWIPIFWEHKGRKICAVVDPDSYVEELNEQGKLVEKLCKAAFKDATTDYIGADIDHWWAEFKLHYNL